MKPAVAVLVFFPIIVNSSMADYHYVSHTGSDEHPYTSWETAADSIHSAVAAAEPWDTIFIGAGDYNELFFAAPGDSCLSFIGAGSDSTRIWSPDSIPDLWLVRNKTFVKGLYFDARNPARNRTCLGGYIGAAFTALDCKFIGASCISGVGEHMIVRNCQLLSFEYLIFGYGDSVIIQNNYCHTDVSSGSMIECDFIRAEFTNNIFTAEVPNQMFLQGYGVIRDTLLFRNNYIARLSDGVLIDAIPMAVMENNTAFILYHPFFGRGVELRDYDDYPTEARVSNNVFVNGRYGVEDNFQYNAQSHALVSYNCFWGHQQADIFSDFSRLDTVGNFRAFPMLVNPDSDDVHLQMYSPLIDAGDPAILDVDGSRSDVGVFGGPGGSNYTYQDLPPLIPDSISYRVWNDTIYLDWRDNYEADLAGYMLHRDIVSGFTPSPSNLIAEPDSSLYSDPDVVVGETYFYRLASLDNQGNRSEYASEIAVVVTGIWQGDGAEMPRMAVIESNYPNPFNSATTIIYTVANLGPIPAQINIDIYDMLGRKVRALLDDRKEIGSHKITWDGKDDAGNELTSGIYFARIMQWHEVGLSRDVKLVLVR